MPAAPPIVSATISFCETVRGGNQSSPPGGDQQSIGVEPLAEAQLRIDFQRFIRRWAGEGSNAFSINAT